METSKFVISTVAFVALISFVPLTAVDTINLDASTGTWTNAASGGGTPTNFSGGGTNEIHWGNPVEGTSNSGYLFVGNAPLTNLFLDTPFELGTFTHFNFPITGNALTSVDLSVNAILNINSTPQAFLGSYHFLHNETPNNPTQQDPNCCNDIVTFQNNVGQSGVFNIGGIDYTIGLIGFKTTVNGPLLTQFSTIENQQNNAILFAQISKPSVFVPEPSTYLGLGTFLAICFFLNYRRKQKALF